MNVFKSFSVLTLSVMLFSCSQGHKAEMAEESQMADSSAGAFVSSSAAVENGRDSARKFIRTAELKFRVKDVLKSTLDIEDITGRHGGFVTYNNLTGNTDNVTTTQISADSSLETTYYTVTNLVTLRVPNTKLDTVIREIAKNIDFLDYRIIKADDIGLQILSNNLAQKRAAKNEKRLTDAIDNRGRKLNETTDAEELLMNRQEQADNAKISNLSLNDEVMFSTVNLSLYQRQTIRRELISNDKNIDAYEPGLGLKLKEAFRYGWKILESLLIVFTRMWALILAGVIVFIIFRKYKHRLK